jgi:hypothetical protein
MNITVLNSLAYLSVPEFRGGNVWSNRRPSLEKKSIAFLTFHSATYIYIYFANYFREEVGAVFYKLARFNFRLYEGIHDSKTLKMRERTAPSLLHH